MTPAPKVLFVTWQDEKSRRIVPIGRLMQTDAGYEFAYIEAVDEACRLGFEPLPPFPDLDAVYLSPDLPPLVTNRVMRPTREDFPRFLNELGLTVADAAAFSVLARSGGHRATDRLEVFAPPQRCEAEMEGLFLVRGVRHVEGADAVVAQLQVGDRLWVEREPDNPATALALRLQDDAAQQVGYVPDYLANELARIEADPAALVVTVLKVNPPPAPSHHRVLCRFTCSVSLGEQLFQGSPYKPIPSGASPIAA